MCCPLRFAMKASSRRRRKRVNLLDIRFAEAKKEGKTTARTRAEWVLDMAFEESDDESTHANKKHKGIELIDLTQTARPEENQGEQKLENELGTHVKETMHTEVAIPEGEVTCSNGDVTQCPRLPALFRSLEKVLRQLAAEENREQQQARQQQEEQVADESPIGPAVEGGQASLLQPSLSQ